MKKRSDDSVDALSAKLDAEIARRKDLTLKVTEKEAQLASLSAAVDAEDAALERETQEKKAELERLRAAIARTAALVQQRNGDAVRIAADAAGVEKALTALKAQMASRFVPSLSHGLQLSEAEVQSLSSKSGRHGVEPLSMAQCASDATGLSPRTVASTAGAWCIVDVGDGLTLDDPDLLAELLTSHVAAAIVEPDAAAPVVAVPPPVASNRAPPRRMSIRSAAESRAASVGARHEATATTFLGCSEEEAQHLVEHMLQSQIRRVGQLVLDAHRAGEQRCTFDQLASTDTALPAPPNV